MKSVFSMLAGLAVVCVLGLAVQADEKGKEVTLTGTLKCPKCALKEADAKECGNVLEVKKDGKTTLYYLKDKGKGEKYHACTKPKENVTVTGTVKVDGKKSVIESPKVKAD